MKKLFEKKRTNAAIILLLMMPIYLLIPNTFAADKPWDSGHNTVEVDKDPEKEPPKDPCAEKGSPVHLKQGNYFYSHRDISLPGRGLELEVIRQYDSQDFYDSPFGIGWKFNLEVRLIETTDEFTEYVTIRQGDGVRLEFTRNKSGTYSPPPGRHDQLIKDSDGTFTWCPSSGCTSCSTCYHFDKSGYLAFLEDANDNQISFTYDSERKLIRVTDDLGRQLDLTYDTNSKIASITDIVNRTFQYAYDSSGNLAGFTDPLGNRTTYAYDSEHNLISVVDARGNAIATITYDDDDQVVSYTEKGEIWIYSFDEKTNSKYKDDLDGNRWTYLLNETGQLLSLTDPLGNTTTNTWDDDINRTSVTDYNGFTTTYTYNADGNKLTETDPLGNKTTYTYGHQSNKVTTVTDPLGRSTKYEYDSNGNNSKVIEDHGGSLQKETTFTYDTHGRLASETDPLGNTTTYAYTDNADGSVTQVTDPLGNKTTVSYDIRGNKLTEIDALGNTTSYSYDLMNRLVSQRDELGNVTSFTYDSVGNLVSRRDANGNVWSFRYDAYNRLLQEIDPLGNTLFYLYDSRGNRVGETDAKGNTTTYEYDALNRIIRQTDALGGVTDFTYDANGNLLTTKDANGNSTTSVYDAINRRVSVTNALGETTTFGYDAVGNQISGLPPNGNTKTITYDSLNRQIAVTDTLGQRRSYIYDLAGSLVTSSDALGNTTTYSYDANKRRVKKIDAPGNTTSFTYDAVGNLLTTTDREGNATTIGYDARKRMISFADQLGKITTFSYDKVGNQISTTDANGKVTSYAYDKTNRLIRESYADDTKRTFTYDANGNMATTTDQKGTTITYSYDALNRVTGKDYPGTNDSVYTYDSVGNVLTANNQNSANTFTYNKVNQRTQSVQNGKTVRIAYDSPKNRRMITYPGGKVVKETRNPRGTLIKVEDGTGKTIVECTLDKAERPLSQSYLNGVTGTFTYNANSWIEEIHYNDGEDDILAFHYGLDKEGNRLYTNRSNDPSNSEQFVYDAKYGLVQFKRGVLDAKSEIPSPATQTSYTLDALGNWLTKTTNGIVGNRTHNEMNEVTVVDGVTHTYDDNGNLINDGSHSYEYDFEDRLVKVVRNSDSSIVGEYTYDALGKRVAKKVSGVTTNHYYFGEKLIEEQIGGATECTYVYGKGPKDIVQVSKRSEEYYCHQDIQSSVVGVTDSSGDIVERYLCDPYGGIKILDGSGKEIQASSVGNRFSFLGMFRDDETGLYYSRRYFKSSIGRYLNRDHSLFMDGVNPYTIFGGVPFIREIVENQTVPPNANAVSKCGLSSDVDDPYQIATSNTNCTKTCSQRHENKHASDRIACCRKAREAYQDAWTRAGRSEVVRKWNKLLKDSKNWSECRAHSVSVECAKSESFANACHCPEKLNEGEKKCCGDYKTYAKNQKGLKDSFCGKPGANTAPACPFD